MSQRKALQVTMQSIASANAKHCKSQRKALRLNNVNYTSLSLRSTHLPRWLAVKNMKKCVITYKASAINGINDRVGTISTLSVDGNVVVLNANGQNVEVFSTTGATLFSGIGDAKTVVNVGPGIYIVRVGNTVKRVVVE